MGRKIVTRADSLVGSTERPGKNWISERPRSKNSSSSSLSATITTSKHCLRVNDVLKERLRSGSIMKSSWGSVKLVQIGGHVPKLFCTFRVNYQGTSMHVLSEFHYQATGMHVLSEFHYQATGMHVGVFVMPWVSMSSPQTVDHSCFGNPHCWGWQWLCQQFKSDNGHLQPSVHRFLSVAWPTTHALSYSPAVPPTKSTLTSNCEIMSRPNTSTQREIVPAFTGTRRFKDPSSNPTLVWFSLSMIAMPATDGESKMLRGVLEKFTTTCGVSCTVKRSRPSKIKSSVMATMKQSRLVALLNTNTVSLLTALIGV